MPLLPISQKSASTAPPRENDFAPDCIPQNFLDNAQENRILETVATP
jgi:hypothetical protein